MADFTLSSSAFAAGEAIPARHGCDGEDRSPPLDWSGVPTEARSLALIVDDPDAPVGTFTHWLAWGIDPGSGGLDEGEPAPVEGRNDFGATGYRGPCPPPGHGRHRYHALDRELDVPPGASRQESPDLSRPDRGAPGAGARCLTVRRLDEHTSGRARSTARVRQRASMELSSVGGRAGELDSE